MIQCCQTSRIPMVHKPARGVENTRSVLYIFPHPHSLLWTRDSARWWLLSLWSHLITLNTVGGGRGGGRSLLRGLSNTEDWMWPIWVRGRRKGWALQGHQAAQAQAGGSRKLDGFWCEVWRRDEVERQECNDGTKHTDKNKRKKRKRLKKWITH